MTAKFNVVLRIKWDFFYKVMRSRGQDYGEGSTYSFRNNISSSSLECYWHHLGEEDKGMSCISFYVFFLMTAV